MVFKAYLQCLRHGTGIAACLVFSTAALPVLAQTMDAQFAVCTNKSGQFSPGERVRDCTRILEEADLDLAHRVAYLVERAEAYVGSKLPRAALADLDQAIALATGGGQPDDFIAPIHGLRANARYEVGDATGALEDYDRAATLDPTVEVFRRGRVALLEAKGEFARALPDYDYLLKSSPSAGLYAARARVHRLNKNLARALDDFDSALKLDPNQAQVHYDRGLVLSEQGKLAEAAAAFDAALKLSPGAVNTLRERGLIRVRQGDSTAAIADLTEVIRLAPDNWMNHATRGRAYRIFKDPARALVDLNQALELKSDAQEGLIERALVYIDTKNYDSALSDLRLVTDIDSMNLRPYILIGQIRFSQKKYEEAVGAFDEGLLVSPNNPNALEWLCVVYSRMAQLEERGLTECDRSISVRDTLPARSSRAFLFLRRGDNGKAIDDYNRALGMAGATARSRYGRGLAQLRLGRTSEGQADIAVALAQDPQIAASFLEFGLKP